MKRHQLACVVVCLLTLGTVVCQTRAAPVEIQLVKHGSPEQLIFGGDSNAELLDGGYVDRCEVLIDGKNLFPPRDLEAQRLQTPEIKVEVAPGKHTVTPGGHDFAVGADGKLTSNDPALAVDGNRLKVLMTPLTLETRDAESGKRRVPGLLQAALDGDGRVFNRPWHFNPRYPTAARIYVPTGSKLVLQPQGAELEIDATGAAVKSDPSNSLKAENLTVSISMTPFRFTFQRNGHQDGRGISLRLQSTGQVMEHLSVYQWGAASCDYKVLLPASPAPFAAQAMHSVHEFGRMAPGASLGPACTFDNREFPYSSLLVSRLDERSEGTFIFLAGISKLKYRSGDAINIRHSFSQDGITPEMKGAHPVALLQAEYFMPRDTRAWQALDIAKDGEEAVVSLPADLPTNRYRLRVAMVEENGDATSSTLYRDFLIGVVNPAQQAVATLFLPALRWNYLAGEEIEAQGTLQLTSPAAGNLRLRVRGERLDRTLDATAAKQFAVGRFGQGWVLRSEITAALKPGSYSLTVIFAGEDGKTIAESLPQQVTLTSTVRPRLFPGIIDVYAGGVRPWLGIGADVMRFDAWNSILPPPGMLPMETRHGPEMILTDDPDLPPLEPTTVPQSTWLSFDEAVPYRAAVLPSLFPSDGPRIETELPDLLAEQRRFIRLHVQYLRRYPTYAGISYSHWSGPTYIGAAHGSTNNPPDDVTKATRQASWDNFCKQSGFTGDPPTTWLPLSIPNGGAATPANPKLWEQWVRYMNALLPNVHRDWGRAASEVCPQLVNTDSRGAPGFGNTPRWAYDAYPFGNIYRNTDGFNLIEGVTNDDWGIEPYSLELMADLFGFGWRQGKPVWVGGWAQNGVAQSEYQREAVQTLARGALPALYGASLAPVFSSRANDDWMHQDWGRRQATQRVFQTTAAYGEWAWRFKTDKPLAILVSSTQSGLREGRTGYAAISSHGAAIYEAYVACLLAGYSPTFIFEEEIAADPTLLNGFKGVLLINITAPLPDPITGALKTFAAGGGAVIADALGAKDLPATARIDVSFNAYLKYGSTEFGKENNSTEYAGGYWWHLRKIALDKRDVVQAALDEVAPPARAEGPGVLLTSAKAGDGLLVYATNDTPLPYKYSTEMARPYAYLHQCWTSPLASARVTLRADGGALYDALRLREVPLEKTPDGLRFTASFPDLSGTIYVLLPRRIQAVKVDGAARAGTITLRATAVDDAGKAIGAPVPLEIVVTDAAQSERYRLYRASGPDGWAEDLPVSVNDLPGDWTITVRELLSGRSVAAKIAVQPPAAPWTPAVRPSLVVTDQPAVTAFFQSTRPITIALDRRQASLAPLAKKWADELTAGKHPTSVRWLDEMPRGPVYTKMLWSGSPLPPNEPVRGPVILIGMPSDNVLLTKLADAGLLLRQASADYPGAGGAVVTHIWSAFTGDDPALAVMADSDDGLQAAIDYLRIGLLAKGETRPAYDPAPTVERARAEVMPAMFRQTWAKQPMTPSSVSADTVRALKPLGGTPGQSGQWAINSAGVAIRALAVSADGKVCAVGSDSAIHGVTRVVENVTEKTDAPRQNRQFVQQIALTPYGRYTVAATTQPPAVFVLDAAGKELWNKTDIPFDWGNDPRWTRDEPDYFALSPQGDRLVIREKEQRLVCYATVSGKQLWERAYAGADPRIWRDAHKLRFSGDGKRLVVSVTSYLTDPEAAKKLGNTSTDALPADLKALDGEARHRLLSLDPASGEIQWTCSERTIPIAASAPRRHPFFGLISPRSDLDARALSFQPRVLGYYLSVSANGDRIVASDELGYHSVYSGAGKLLASYVLPGRPCVSPDGATLAVYRDTVVLVDLASGKQQSLKLEGEEEISDIAWSADVRRLAVARWDGLIHVVETSGKMIETVRQARGVGAVLLQSPAPHQGWLAGTSDGQLLRIESLATTVRVDRLK